MIRNRLIFLNRYLRIDTYRQMQSVISYFKSLAHGSGGIIRDAFNNPLLGSR